MKKNLLKVSAVALLAMPFGTARADLVFNGLVDLGGTGLGSVNTVLTIANSPTELGSVCWNGTTTVLGATVNTVTGVCSGTGDQNGLNSTQLLSATGVTTGSNYAILFNPNEPGNDQTLTLNTLVATFYNNAGQLIFSAPLAVPNQTFNAADQGTGNTGFEFVLTSAEAATLQGFITALGTTNIHVGLASSLGNPISSDGGHETFFVFNSGIATVTPEPSTTVLMATGLFGLVGFVRRRRS
jgi:PEP-CTERM putative exosortase interaction domain